MVDMKADVIFRNGLNPHCKRRIFAHWSILHQRNMGLPCKLIVRQSGCELDNPAIFTVQLGKQLSLCHLGPFISKIRILGHNVQARSVQIKECPQ